MCRNQLRCRSLSLVGFKRPEEEELVSKNSGQMNQPQLPFNFTEESFFCAQKLCGWNGFQGSFGQMSF